MLKTSISPINAEKHSRLTKRNVECFADIDRKIKVKLSELEQNNSNLWTAPAYNKNEFIHSIFQYPAMMVPEVQRQIIDVIFGNANSQQIRSMIDPFMGSATSLISSMHYGIDCYGQDINPLAILISKVRTTLVNVNFKRLKKNSKLLIERIKTDNSIQLEANFNNQEKWFKNEVAIELSKIVRAIRQETDLTIRRFYWANLAEVIRICSNDRTSTFKLHARNLDEIELREISPIAVMIAQLKESTLGYIEFKDFLRRKGRLSTRGYKGNIRISYGDSSKSLKFDNLDKDFAELLVSSPPYGDNHTTVTYGQYSYLQLQWIDLEDINENIDKDCLKSTQEIDSKSIGGKRSDSKLLEKAQEICYLSKSFENDFKNFIKLEKDLYAKIVIFQHDLIKVIQHSLRALKTNSYMVWTMGDRNVGNLKVQNVIYLKEILLSNGCIFVHSLKRKIVNKRMAKKNSAGSLMNTEDILIFRKI